MLQLRTDIRSLKHEDIRPEAIIDKLMTYDDYIYDDAIKAKKAELYA